MYHDFVLEILCPEMKRTEGSVFHPCSKHVDLWESFDGKLKLAKIIPFVEAKYFGKNLVIILGTFWWWAESITIKKLAETVGVPERRDDYRWDKWYAASLQIGGYDFHPRVKRTGKGRDFIPSFPDSLKQWGSLGKHCRSILPRQGSRWIRELNLSVQFPCFPSPGKMFWDGSFILESPQATSRGRSC